MYLMSPQSLFLFLFHNPYVSPPENKEEASFECLYPSYAQSNYWFASFGKISSCRFSKNGIHLFLTILSMLKFVKMFSLQSLAIVFLLLSFLYKSSIFSCKEFVSANQV